MRISLKDVFVNMYPQSMAAFKNSKKGANYSNEDYRWLLIAAGVLSRNQELPKTLTESQKDAGRNQVKIFEETAKESLIYNDDGTWEPRIICELTLGGYNDEDYQCSSCYAQGEFNILVSTKYQKCLKCGQVEGTNFTEVYGDNPLEVDNFLYNLSESLEPFNHDAYIIEGRNLGWMNRSGTGNCEANAESIFDFISMNTDYSVNVTILFDGTIEVVRYHHDSPTGEYMEFKPALHCDIYGEDGLFLAEDIEKAQHQAQLVGILKDHDKNSYEYLCDDAFEEQVAYHLDNLYEEELYALINELAKNSESFSLSMAENIMLTNEKIAA